MEVCIPMRIFPSIQAGGRGSGSGSGRYSSSGSKSVGTAMRCSSGMPVGISAPLKLLILAHAPSARTLGTAALESTPAACEGYDFSRRSWLAPYREDLCAGVSKLDGKDRLATDAFLQLKAAAKQSRGRRRSEEHTSELQSRLHLVCRLLLEKTKTS